MNVGFRRISRLKFALLTCDGPPSVDRVHRPLARPAGHGHVRALEVVGRQQGGAGAHWDQGAVPVVHAGAQDALLKQQLIPRGYGRNRSKGANCTNAIVVPRE